jgi:hypothetical protein
MSSVPIHTLRRLTVSRCDEGHCKELTLMLDRSRLRSNYADYHFVLSIPRACGIETELKTACLMIRIRLVSPACTCLTRDFKLTFDHQSVLPLFLEM